MPYFVGLDSSKRTTSVCVIDRDGAVVREGVVATDPRAIVAFLRGERRRYVRVGIEAWTLSSWLYEGLTAAGLPTVCIEVRHAHGVMKAQRHKTDRNDAKGIAELMRLGAYRKVHVKSRASQEARAMITVRTLLVEKTRDLSNAIHGLLLSFGIKLGRLKPGTFEQRVRALVAGRGVVQELADALLQARAAILRQRRYYTSRTRNREDVL